MINLGQVKELRTLLEHLSSPPVFSGVRVTRSLVLYVCFVGRCLSFCLFFLVIVLLFLDVRFLITSLWHLQTLLTGNFIISVPRDMGTFFIKNRDIDKESMTQFIDRQVVPRVIGF